MIKAVICDDDSVVRRVVAELATEVGLEVVAETDQGGDVLELVRRFGMHVVVLDLSLGSMSGSTLVSTLLAEQPTPVIVVFSAYAHDSTDLLARGVAATVEKPDFESLQAALTDAVATVQARLDASEPDKPSERRQASRVVPEPPLAWRSTSRLEPAAALPERLDGCEVGDTALAVAVGGTEAIAASHGALLAADCALEPGRALRAAARAQDHVLVEPACDGFLALLRGGDERSAEVVWRRTAARLDRSPATPPVAAAWVAMDGDVSPVEARARAVGTAVSAVAAGRHGLHRG